MAENPLKKGRYTQYSNKIGLFSNDKRSFIKNDSEVVLNFPFKDAVLEAGMNKEDQGREERFLHLTMDKKDIDTLEEPKVLTNFRYIDAEGETPLTASSDIKFFDENGDLTQNLLIKGNNLLALYTLRERLAGKVKLIYIDPPYNTGNDSFKYNDKFNHAAWLTFMKNRLEVARELLRDDGVIFIQCDDNEQAYLKVLMDEVFGRDNFIINLIWENKEGGGKSDSKFFRKKHEYIINYAKNIGQTEIKGLPVEDTDRYKFSDEHESVRGKYQLIKLDSGSLGWVKSLDYPIELNGRTYYAGGDKVKWEKRQAGGAATKDWGWRWSKDKLKWGLENDFVVTKQGQDGKWNIYTKQYLNVDEYGNIKPRTLQPTGVIEKYSNTQSNKHMKELFGTAIFTYSKPEGLLNYLLEIASNEGDLVLEFCLGSGTTAAVAHKMNRRWVGIEQMDYIETIAKERLKKVIAGEQGGVSKAVGWSGGGSFVYFELKKYNQEYIDRITDAASLKALEEIYVEMRNNAFLKFWFDRKEFEQDENFRNLNIQQRKQKIIEVLDENQLYLNYADMNDTRHKVTADEKALTDRFYGKD